MQTQTRMSDFNLCSEKSAKWEVEKKKDDSSVSNISTRLYTFAFRHMELSLATFSYKNLVV